jgi:uncharacterized membrane protein (UPF0182 family)
MARHVDDIEGFPRIEGGAHPRRFGCLLLAIIVFLVLAAGRASASYVIDLAWWRELGQLSTYFSMLAYEIVPAAIAAAIAFVVFWVAHARALKYAGTGLGQHRWYARIATLAILVLAIIIGVATTDTWTVVRYFGGRGVAGQATAWHDPVFNQPLAFYLFELPFYSVLLRFVFTVVVVSAILYWAAARAWQLTKTIPDWRREPASIRIDLRLPGALESRFGRLLGAVFLIALAVYFFLGRYEMLLNDHGFMVGIDYTNQYFSLPLQWVVIVASILSAIAVVTKHAKWAAIVVLALVVRAIIPPIVAAAYVRPNEISLEKPFITRHIEATRSAFGLDRNMTEIDFPAKSEAAINVNTNQAVLQNVRLWDWGAFQATVAQIQPLRPYTYEKPDVDRYQMGGNIRQVLLSARELDLNQLGDARSRWINPHFIYTHGYGVVMAEANRITPNGLPVLLIRDAPPVITAPDLKLTQPDLYYSEVAHDPVFVHTAQPEFDYPAGAHNVDTRYGGKGGFPISSLWMRVAAAVSEGDWNILLTSYLTPESRMMIHRRVVDRLDQLANFILWDGDPYLVVTDNGRLVWIVDGYMTSNAHPYSRTLDLEGVGSVNYIRNSIKATVDAYDGTVHMYVFDPADPLVNAYRNLFPDLFQDASAMPADLRRHARYPELIFRIESEIYRTFHMRDPETFYNKSDAWDIAKFTSGQTTQAQPVQPTYIIAAVPGSTKPEFVQVIPFTPRNRDNLIGFMMARCDGDSLGEKLVLMLPKQEIILGPLQVDARINQDQVISKDLTLWSQQGSQVLRGQMLVLPIQDTFLYIEPIYLQASEARMPQLKKVVLAMGNTLIYADSYEQALAQLAAGLGQTPEAPATVTTTTAAPAAAPATPAGSAGDLKAQARRHLDRYRELMGQGKWSEAGKELEALQQLLSK